MPRSRHEGINIATIRDILRMRESLWISCLDCQHDAPVSSIVLIERGFGDRAVNTLQYRCTKCGSSRGNPRLDKYPVAGPPKRPPAGKPA